MIIKINDVNITLNLDNNKSIVNFNWFINQLNNNKWENYTFGGEFILNTIVYYSI